MPKDPRYYDFGMTIEQALALRVLTDNFLEEHEGRTSELVQQTKEINARLHQFVEAYKARSKQQ